MPILDFECTACQRKFEALVSREDADRGATDCEWCAELAVRVGVSAPGGYHINGDNSASRRPKGAGSFKKGSDK